MMQSDWPRWMTRSRSNKRKVMVLCSPNAASKMPGCDNQVLTVQSLSGFIEAEWRVSVWEPVLDK